MEFVFPVSLLELDSLNSPEAIKEMLYSQILSHGLDRKCIRYRLLIQKRKYCYLRCSYRDCRSYLRFQLSQTGDWRLSKAYCHHLHQLPKCKKFQFSVVSQYLQTIPITVPPFALKSIVCSEFGITPKQFYYGLAKNRENTITIDQMVAQLEQENVHSSGKKWKIGCFLGTSSCRKIVPLALVASLL